MIKLKEEEYIKVLKGMKKQGFRNVLILDDNMIKRIPQILLNHSITFRI
jgi:hypothetical protein